MPSLDTQPNTVSKDQLARMHAIARDLGMDHAALRESAGVESLRELSKAEASRLITRLGGGDLPNEPGQARRPPRRRSDPNTTRMITPAHVEQIRRMGLDYFDGDTDRLVKWLRRWRDHERCTLSLGDGVDDAIRELRTAQRASEVIRALRIMHNRASRPEGGRAPKPSRARKEAVPHSAPSASQRSPESQPGTEADSCKTP